MRKGTYFLLSCLLSLLSCYTEFKKLEYVVLYGDLNASGADNMAGAAVAMVVYPLFAAVFYGIIQGLYTLFFMHFRC